MSLLGERLRQAREARGVAPLQVEIDTRIRAAVIQLLEEGDYDHLPPQPYLQGLVRSYANYLNADAQEMLDLLMVDLAARETAHSARQHVQKPTPPPIPNQPESEPENFAPDQPFQSPTPTIAEPALPTESVGGSPKNFSEYARGWLAAIKQLPVPLPAVLLGGALVGLVCLACGWFIFAQLTATASSPGFAQRTLTSTRPFPTATPTVVPGSAPTKVPTFDATAAPFATFPGNPTPTLKVTPRRTLEYSSGLNLDIDVTQVVTVQVGIDGLLVFSGQIAPGTSRSWSAKQSLYVRVENPRGATIYFNGDTKWFLPRVLAERNVIERRWILNEKGTPIATTPLTPVAATPTKLAIATQTLPPASSTASVSDSTSTPTASTP